MFIVCFVNGYLMMFVLIVVIFDVEDVCVVVGGDCVVFQWLYCCYVDCIYGVVLCLVGYDYVCVEDFIQDVFVWVWQKFVEFCYESVFGIWFYWLVVNLVLMDICVWYVDLVGFMDDDVLFEYGDMFFCVVECDELEWVIVMLLLCVCVVLVLYDIEGWKYEDISWDLDMVVGIFKVQLYCVCVLLCKLLGEIV